jgi:hypothetical protein
MPYVVFIIYHSTVLIILLLDPYLPFLFTYRHIFYAAIGISIYASSCRSNPSLQKGGSISIVRMEYLEREREVPAFSFIYRSMSPKSY